MKSYQRYDINVAMTLVERCPDAPAEWSECQDNGHDRGFKMVRDEPLMRDHQGVEGETESRK